MNLLVLSFDGLHSGFLGYAGCTWAPTPAFDRLAGEGLVFDKLFADRLEPTAVMNQLWTGKFTPPINKNDQDNQDNQDNLNNQDSSLAKTAADAGYVTALITDDPDILSLSAAEDFQIVESAAAEKGVGSEQLPPSSVDETDAVRVFSSIASLLNNITQEDPDVPFFCWAHLNTLGRIWDAPEEYRGKYTAEGDPEPLDFVKVPNYVLPEYHGQYAPDEQLQIAQTYAGQIAVVDECLAALWDYLAESGRLEDTAILLMSTRGMGLGEHGVAGNVSPSFQTEYARLTAVLRIPDEELFLRRTQALAALSDFHDALNFWFKDCPGNGPRTGKEAEELTAEEFTAEDEPGLYSLFWDELVHYRDRIVTREYNQHLVQTPAWRYLYNTSQPKEGQLYAQPDDRWEVNDVSAICGSVIEKLLLVDPKEGALDSELTNTWH